jgi:Tfp pilus assembly protein PilO
LILTGVLALVVCVVFYFFFIRPRNAELEDTNAAIEAAQIETTTLQEQLRGLRELKEQAPQLQAELNEFRNLVPKQVDIDVFTFQVQDAAVASGVGFVQIDPEDPKPPPEGAPLAQVRATIGAHGGYFSIQDFVRRISELDRAVSIDSVNMTTLEEGEADAEQEGPINLQMTIRIFFEVPEQQAPVTAPGTVPVPVETAAPATTPAPGETAAPATPAPAATTPAG